MSAGRVIPEAIARPLSVDERAELELLRDLRARVIGFGGDDYTLAAWIDAHRLHGTEPYIGCPFCRPRFVATQRATVTNVGAGGKWALVVSGSERVGFFDSRAEAETAAADLGLGERER